LRLRFSFFHTLPLKLPFQSSLQNFIKRSIPEQHEKADAKISRSADTYQDGQ